MASTNFPEGWHDVVRRFHVQTAGYIVAQSGDCLDVLYEEASGPHTKVPGRKFNAIPPSDLANLRMPPSWFMGVILCPGDDASPIAGWFAMLDAKDHDRVVLYTHPRFDEEKAAEAWEIAKAPLPRRTQFAGSWNNFHRLFGNDFSWQVWKDHGPPR